MKPTKSILILLSLFLIFSCDDKNPVGPLVCDEGLTNVDGECYYQSDLDVLQDIIDVNESLSGEEPLDIGRQSWTSGRLVILYLNDNQLTTLPDNFGNLSSLQQLKLYNNQLTSLPDSFCNLNIDWGGKNIHGMYYFSIYNNQLCSSIPTCIVDYLGEQDCED